QIQKRPPFIQRLPVELLSPILRFAVIGTNPSQEGEILARVWRCWRDVVLANPSFWSVIEIVGSQKSSPAARLHLKGSCQELLDIDIQVGIQFRQNECVHGGLDLLIPCANRWRSLSVSSQTRRSTPYVMDHLGSVGFPSLKRAELELKVKAFPNFLTTGKASKLWYFVGWTWRYCWSPLFEITTCSVRWLFGL
ncbi:hypothetical protein BKA82DRAFT_3983236, partial [Pisolithus tinctorius]